MTDNINDNTLRAFQRIISHGLAGHLFGVPPNEARDLINKAFLDNHVPVGCDAFMRLYHTTRDEMPVSETFTDISG